MLKGLTNYLSQHYQSLIFRILLYFLFSAIAVAIVLGWSFTSRIKPHFINEILPNLSQYVQYLVEDIGTPPDIEKAKSLTRRLPFDLRIDGAGMDWSSTQRLSRIDTYRFKTAPRPYQEYAVSQGNGDYLLLIEKGEFRYLFSVENNFRSGSRSRHGLLFILLAAILITLYFAIRRLTRPVHDISTHLKKIGTGQLDLPLDVPGKGELSQLAHGINDMTIEIRSMLESKAGLLLAISHELRSPITRMRVNLELLEDDKTRQVLIRDLHEMEDLVVAILESERLNSRHAKLNRSQFDLAGLIETVVEQNFESCDIKLSIPPMMVVLDEMRIRLLVRNLIGNACRYSLDSDKAVDLRLHREGEMLEFGVTDYGQGVDAKDLAHITEPFYRADSARQRKTGGYGLGLYLCRLIVEAHGGTLEIQSVPGLGMTVKVRMPVL